MGHAWRRRLGVTASIVVLLSVLATGVAHAQRVVLESYVGPRPAGAQRVMDALRRELPSRYKGQPSILAELFSDHVPKPGIQDARYVSDVFVAEVRGGVEAYLNAEFVKAIQRLDAAIALARRNPAMIAREPAALAAMRRALVYAALANKRMAEGARSEAQRGSYATARDAWMAELLRSFRALPVRHDEFGSEAEELYLTARRTWERTALGALEIVLPEPLEMSTISVNEMSAAAGLHKDLLPGAYRVLVQSPLGKREYIGLVNSDEVTRVVIDWNLDTLFVSGEWVGFHYANDTQKAREASWVARLLRGTSVREALVVSMRVVGRKLLLEASLYDVGGQCLRQASVELTSPYGNNSRERLREFIARIDMASDTGATRADASVASAATGPVSARPLRSMEPGAHVPAPADAAEASASRTSGSTAAALGSSHPRETSVR